jgi:hypothetical protein
MTPAATRSKALTPEAAAALTLVGAGGGAAVTVGIPWEGDVGACVLMVLLKPVQEELLDLVVLVVQIVVVVFFSTVVVTAGLLVV